METNNNQIINYKLVLCGDGGVGKTTYITKLLSGEFEKKYIPTLGVEAHSLLFHTNKGRIEFNIWDTAGQEKYRGLRNAYSRNTDCVIIMFDLTNNSTFKNIDYWYNIAKKYTDNIVLCGNMHDVREHKIKQEQIEQYIEQYIENKNIKYYNISARSNYNINEPFIYLTQQLLGDNNLEFVNKPTINAPTI